MCFEHPSVHSQEDLYLAVWYVHILQSTGLLVWVHGKVP